MLYEPIVIGARGTKNPLVLLHGVMMSKETIAPLAEYIGHGRQVIIPDLLGHGENTEGTGSLTISALAQDVVTLLDRIDSPPFDILGFSLGGLVAQQIAIAYPAKVGNLILVSTYAHKRLTPKERLVGSLGPSFIKLFGLKGISLFVGSRWSGIVLPPEKMQALQTRIMNNNADYTTRVLRAAYAFDSRSHLGLISSSTLIISGSNDVMAPLYHSRMLAEGIATSQFNVINGAGHGLFGAHLNSLSQKW